MSCPMKSPGQTRIELTVMVSELVLNAMAFSFGSLALISLKESGQDVSHLQQSRDPLFLFCNKLSSSNPQLLHLPIQVAAFNIQQFRGAGDVAVAFLQRRENVAAFERFAGLAQGFAFRNVRWVGLREIEEIFQQMAADLFRPG